MISLQLSRSLLALGRQAERTKHEVRRDTKSGRLAEVRAARLRRLFILLDIEVTRMLEQYDRDRGLIR